MCKPRPAPPCRDAGGGGGMWMSRCVRKRKKALQYLTFAPPSPFTRGVFWLPTPDTRRRVLEDADPTCFCAAPVPAPADPSQHCRRRQPPTTSSPGKPAAYEPAPAPAP
ncbi:hypothetical protein AOQ84DRAFT_392804, partial [Glonium stellatum]